MHDRFKHLEELIGSYPAVLSPLASGTNEDGSWWVKFAIDTAHPFAWKLVQMLAYTINHLSISERLSSVFYPMSPQMISASEVNALEWIIESTAGDFVPAEFAIWLETRMPANEEMDTWR